MMEGTNALLCMVMSIVLLNLLILKSSCTTSERKMSRFYLRKLSFTVPVL